MRPGDNHRRRVNNREAAAGEDFYCCSRVNNPFARRACGAYWKVYPEVKFNLMQDNLMHTYHGWLGVSWMCNEAAGMNNHVQRRWGGAKNKRVNKRRVSGAGRVGRARAVGCSACRAAIILVQLAVAARRRRSYTAAAAAAAVHVFTQNFSACEQFHAAWNYEYCAYCDLGFADNM